MLKFKKCNSKDEWNLSLISLNSHSNLFLDWNNSENFKFVGNKILRILIYSDNILVGLYQAVINVSNIILIKFINVRCGGREEGEGIVFSDEFKNINRILVLKSLMKFVKKLLKSEFWMINIFYFGYYHLNKKLLPGFKQWLTKTPLIDLTKNDLWMNLDKKHRNEIRQSKKRDVIVKINNTAEGLEHFYDLATPYWKKLNKTKWLNDKQLFFKYYNVCFDNGILNLFMAYVKSEPAAFALIWNNYGSEKIIYGEGGVVDKFKWNRPSHLLIWKVIEWGKINGFKVFDMAGGSNNPKNKLYSISQFKMKFGAELNDVFKYHKLSL